MDISNRTESNSSTTSNNENEQPVKTSAPEPHALKRYYDELRDLKIIPGLKDYELFFIEGDVLEIQESSSTSVQSYGGTATVTNHGTYVSPPVIYSTTTQCQKVWIKTFEGQERDLSLYDQNLSARKGHKMVFICAKNKKEKNGFIVAYYNLNTDFWRCVSKNHNVGGRQKSVLLFSVFMAAISFLGAMIIPKAPIVMKFTTAALFGGCIMAFRDGNSARSAKLNKHIPHCVSRIREMWPL